MKRTILAIAAATGIAAAAGAQGALTTEMIDRMAATVENTPSHRALRNAVRTGSLSSLARNADNAGPVDSHFSHRVESRGITDQQSSGRCWLFTGLNVLRAKMMARHDLDRLELSQNYNFFYDQLEKANLFLQSIIDTRREPMSDRRVDWLFKNPLSDGGQYTGFSENVMKYGVVPSEAWQETYSSENTSEMRRLLSLKLREDGLRLRDMKATDKELQQQKLTMLAEIYRMLALTLGEPPRSFEWTRRNSAGEFVDRRTYTPQEFYAIYADGENLRDNYVMLMNDPSRPYGRLYEIDLDRHLYDGDNWTFINVDMATIKKAAIASIKDSAAMYFSCDVGKEIDRKRGLLDLDNYAWDDLFGTSFGMSKADRIRTFASASSHAMTLVAVDLDADGKPTRWMVENSWGPGPNDGHLVMTDRWMDEYMFRLVVNKKYVDAETLDILRQKPEKLPAWDPMYMMVDK